MACSKTAFIEFKDCESSYLFEVELTPSTSYFYEITDKFGNVYQKEFTTDEDGYFSISPNDFPPYLLTNAGGNFTLIVKESLTDCSVVDFDYCEDTFDTIVFSFIKNTDSGNAPVVDKCQKVYDCLGISENGSENKFLNEKGVFETPSGGGFSQVQADWNQTDNTEVDFIKNKPSIPSISGLATENYVDTEVSSAISSANGYTDNVSSSKVDKVVGYGLSKNDFTDLLKATYDGYASQISAKASASEVSIVLFKSITQTIVTGKTAETCIYSIPLPVDGLNYIIEVSSQAQISLMGGSAISHRLRVGTYLSPIDGASGADAIGNQTVLGFKSESTAVGFPVTRRFKYFGGATGSIFGISASTNTNDDNVSSSTSTTLKSADLTTQHYLYVSFNPSNVGAVVQHNQILVTATKV